MTENEQTGIDAKRQIKDVYLQGELARLGLPKDASIADVEALATQLLGSPKTLIPGLELVLGRRVDVKNDRELFGSILLGGKTGDERFALALMATSFQKKE